MKVAVETATRTVIAVESTDIFAAILSLLEESSTRVVQYIYDTFSSTCPETVVGNCSLSN